MTMNELLQLIFEIAVIPLLSILTSYLVKQINIKTKELKANTDNVYANKYINLLQDIITKTVVAVNQTYVDALKEQGAFGVAAQKEAFRRVYTNVMLSLSEEAYTYLESAFGDLQTYITDQIEAAVKKYKMPKQQ